MGRQEAYPWAARNGGIAEKPPLVLTSLIDYGKVF